jgi:hypothetical protein
MVGQRATRSLHYLFRTFSIDARPAPLHIEGATPSRTNLEINMDAFTDLVIALRQAACTQAGVADYGDLNRPDVEAAINEAAMRAYNQVVSTVGVQS